MDAPQITAAALFGNGYTHGMALSPYGVGLGSGEAPGALMIAPPGAVQAGTFAPFDGVPFTSRDFLSSAGFGLILLILLVAYFDIRLLNR